MLADEMNETKWSLCFGNLVAFRTKIRTERKIEGSICYDCCAVGFCTLCSLCQMRKEVKATRPLL
jgi:Cys-rich protein (TIGR01571 family)